MGKGIDKKMTAETTLREFNWSRSSIFYPFAALVFWLILAVAQLLAGKVYLALILFALSGKWIYDCYWHWQHPYIQLGKDLIRINRSPLRRQVVYWEYIEAVKESGNKQVEFILYDGKVIKVSLLPLEFPQRNNFVIALRNALSNFQAACPDWGRETMCNRRQARALLERAEKLCDSGRFHKALPLLNEALELYPELERCYLKRGLALFSCGCYEESISDYDRAQQMNPHLAESYYYKALAVEKTGRKAEALKSYQDFLRFAPPRYAPLAKAVRERIRQLQENLETGRWN